MDVILSVLLGYILYKKCRIEKTNIDEFVKSHGREGTVPFAAQNPIGAISNISIGSVICMAPWLIEFSYFRHSMVKMRYQFIALRGLFLIILYCTAFGLTESAEI